MRFLVIPCDLVQKVGDNPEIRDWSEVVALYGEPEGIFRPCRWAADVIPGAHQLARLLRIVGRLPVAASWKQDVLAAAPLIDELRAGPLLGVDLNADYLAAMCARRVAQSGRGAHHDPRGHHQFGGLSA